MDSRHENVVQPKTDRFRVHDRSHRFNAFPTLETPLWRDSFEDFEPDRGIFD